MSWSEQTPIFIDENIRVVLKWTLQLSNNCLFLWLYNKRKQILIYNNLYANQINFLTGRLICIYVINVLLLFYWK